MSTKEIYYNNKIYVVPITNLQHINNTDVVMLDDNTVVFYFEAEQHWKLADCNLELLYKKMVIINVHVGSEITPLKVSADNILEVLDKKLAKITFPAVAICTDETTNTWEILDPTNYLYKLLIMFDQNKSRLSTDTEVVKNRTL
jgi:hypothetical protein